MCGNSVFNANLKSDQRIGEPLAWAGQDFHGHLAEKDKVVMEVLTGPAVLLYHTHKNKTNFQYLCFVLNKSDSYITMCLN